MEQKMKEAGNEGQKMNSPETAVPYEDQKYDVLKAQLVESGSLFEDDAFPAIDASVFFKEAPPHAIQWLRPTVSLTRVDAFDANNSFPLQSL